MLILGISRYFFRNLDAVKWLYFLFYDISCQISTCLEFSGIKEQRIVEALKTRWWLLETQEWIIYTRALEPLGFVYISVNVIIFLIQSRLSTSIHGMAIDISSTNQYFLSFRAHSLQKTFCCCGETSYIMMRGCDYIYMQATATSCRLVPLSYTPCVLSSDCTDILIIYSWNNYVAILK